MPAVCSCWVFFKTNKFHHGNTVRPSLTPKKYAAWITFQHPYLQCFFFRYENIHVCWLAFFFLSVLTGNGTATLFNGICHSCPLVWTSVKSAWHTNKIGIHSWKHCSLTPVVVKNFIANYRVWVFQCCCFLCSFILYIFCWIHNIPKLVNVHLLKSYSFNVIFMCLTTLLVHYLHVCLAMGMI